MKGRLLAVLAVCIMLNLYVKHLIALAHKNKQNLTMQTKKR